MNKYITGLYIRLSKEDSNNSLSSESIINQKDFLIKYLKENNYTLYDIYIDDGYTGTNFNRPSFLRMIKDIEDKKINMVVVKDLSRLGRDYITVGYYIENWFPKNNIRFISVLDGIDSEQSNYASDLAPFKSVINDLYSKENSKKIRASLKTKQELGKWVGGCPPFGYKIDPNDKNHLIINEEEKVIVQKIFNLFLSFYSINKIVNYLNEQKIKTPTIIRGINRDNKYSKLGYWNSTTIKSILKNPLYTGDLVQNRRQRISYKIRKIINNKKEDWIIVNNTHEAIISKNKFEDVQRILKLNSNIRIKKDNLEILYGFLYCGECNSKMIIQRNKNYLYTICNNYRRFSKLNICTSHSYNYYLLEKKILLIINSYLNNIDIYKIINNLKNRFNKKDNIKNRIEILKDSLDKIYLDKLNNEINEEMYLRIKNKIINELDLLNNKKERMINIDKLIINKYLKNINRQLLIKLIKKICIHNNKVIDIYFNFKCSFLS